MNKTEIENNLSVIFLKKINNYKTKTSDLVSDKK